MTMNAPPICANCNTPMRYFAPYTKDDGTSISASWRCPQKCQGTAVWIKDGNGGQRQGNGQRQAQAPARSAPSNDSRDRSIEAQACVKAACEAAAMGVGAAIMVQNSGDTAAVTEWIVTLSRRLLREVIYPATGVPVPQGIAQPRGPFAARGLASAPPADYDEAPPYGEER